MRWIAPLLTCAAAALLSGTALAADEAQQDLVGAAFSGSLDFHTGSGPSVASGSGFSTGRYQPGQGLVRWTSGEVASFGRGGLPYFDTVRLSTAAYDPLPGAALLGRGAAGGTARPQAYDVTYVRKWPALVSLGKGGLSLDITPHAGLGLSSGGGRSAEAGALVRMMKAMGVAGAQAPRWYVFAGYRQRALGLNLLRGEETVRRERLADDGTQREVQAGIGAHRGMLYASVGYTHERVTMRSLGEQSRDDDRVGLSLSIR